MKPECFLKCFILTCACWGIALGANAQDVIVLQDGNEVKAKVTEVGSSEIKYLKHENPDGPTYTLRKSEVFMIRYESGTKDVFGGATQTEPVNRNISQADVLRKNTSGLTRRDPGLAFLYSFLYPGIGQFYARKQSKGWIMAGSFTGAAVVFFAGGTYYETYYDSYWNGSYYEYDYYYDGPYWSTAKWVGLGSMVAIKLWSMIDAPGSANATNRSLGLSRVRITPDSFFVQGISGPSQRTTPQQYAI